MFRIHTVAPGLDGSLALTVVEDPDAIYDDTLGLLGETVVGRRTGATPNLLGLGIVGSLAWRRVSGTDLSISADGGAVASVRTPGGIAFDMTGGTSTRPTVRYVADLALVTGPAVRSIAVSLTLGANTWGFTRNLSDDEQAARSVVATVHEANAVRFFEPDAEGTLVLSIVGHPRAHGEGGGGPPFPLAVAMPGDSAVPDLADVQSGIGPSVGDSMRWHPVDGQTPAGWNAAPVVVVRTSLGAVGDLLRGTFVAVVSDS